MITSQHHGCDYLTIHNDTTADCFSNLLNPVTNGIQTNITMQTNVSIQTVQETYRSG